MKNFKKIAIFVVITLTLCSILSLNAFASAEQTAAETNEQQTDNNEQKDSGKLDMDLKPSSFSERLEYALQGTVTGMLMVFAVLGLLTVILYISKYIFYDIPNKKKARTRPVEQEASVIAAEPVIPSAAYASAPAQAPVQDDGEIAAVITAAIAAMIESGDYKNEFAGGFRVVSFKRSTKTAWNRK